ncbi:MAG TPA: TonB family protein [Bacteroidota bacterium]|nr:TonB family protein [Bacteroidota bacterium]
MKYRKEMVKGWVVSIVVHLLLLLFLFLTDFPQIMQSQEFVEVSWGAALEEKTTPSAPSPTASPEAPPKVHSKTVARPQQPVSVPERRLPDPTDDLLSLPRSDKQEAFQQAPLRADRSPRQSVGDREVDKAAMERGEGERTLPNPGRGASDGLSPTGTSGAGGGIDEGVSFSIQWMEGGTRKKISGDLPQYPKGVNVEAQIKIQTIVMPDGSVKAVQPLQKGNTRLEEAAMKELRFWRFEPLRQSQPQVEQTCTVTFLFKLK